MFVISRIYESLSVWVPKPAPTLHFHEIGMAWGVAKWDGVTVDCAVGVLWKNKCIVMGGGECPYVA